MKLISKGICVKDSVFGRDDGLLFMGGRTRKFLRPGWLIREMVLMGNPVLHADYSDPDVCAVGDDFYMTASSFKYIPGIPILHSGDLVNWSLVNYALPGAGETERIFR